jgi:hypothetical protein
VAHPAAPFACSDPSLVDEPARGPSAIRELRLEGAYLSISSAALAGIIGARRSWTVSMISALSMPRR